MPGVPIVDCLFSLESVSQERTPDAKELAREMDHAAIDRVLLTPCRRWRCERHWGEDGISLAEVNALVTLMPQRFAGMAAYDPYAVPESIALIDLAMENDFRGVYVQTEGSDLGLSDSRLQPLYRKCEREEIPLIVQVGVSMSNIAAPADLAAVCEEYPKLKVVAGVCGAINLAAILELCARCTSLYFAFDGSLLFPDDNRRFRNSEIAFQRAMFGSNGCRWLDLIDNLARIELPYDYMRAFLHDNAASVLKVDVRETVSLT